MRELRKFSGLTLEQVIKLYAAVQRFHEVFAGEKCTCDLNSEPHMAIKAVDQNGDTVLVHARLLSGLFEVSIDASKIFTEGYQASIKIENTGAADAGMRRGKPKKAALRTVEIADVLIDQALGHRPESAADSLQVRAETWTSQE